VPALYATEKVPMPEKIAVAHYFVGGCDWWIAEWDPKTGEAFGFICLGDPANAEWGYIPLTELETINVGGGLAIVERDCWWSPVPFARIEHRCG